MEVLPVWGVFQGISGLTGWKRVNLPGMEGCEKEGIQCDEG
jgi:hypothetical protein